MGRAIVRSPQVFLMDEPLSNLDAKLRVQTRTQIASLQRRLGVTTVYVTHDQIEAMTMGDRVAVLKDGLLQQVDTPRDMYDTPANVFVAGFIGSPAMNIGTFPVVDGGGQLGRATRRRRSARSSASSPPTTRTTSPSASAPSRSTSCPQATRARIPVGVNVVEELGSDAYVYGSLTTVRPRRRGALRCRRRAGHRARRPAQVPAEGRDDLGADPRGRAHLFHAGSGARIEA